MFRSSEEVQKLAVLLLLLFIDFFIKNVPVEFFKKISYLGSFSYALYVIHYPILDFLNHLSIGSDSKLINILLVLLINALGALISITLAWFLECIIHVRIAKVLKKRFNI
jgi:peptidoglycan/LPS O-acetylase OafA/YrhL